VFAGFPRFKKKSGRTQSFRLRNKYPKGGKPAVRVGDNDLPRSVTLPGIGKVRVHDDTRPLRRMLAKYRARILFATVTYRSGRWWVALNVEAADLHPVHRHPDGADRHHGSWVGVDRGLSVFAVAATADGREVNRFDAPKALAVGTRQQRHLSRMLSRKKKGSANRRRARVRLGRHHSRVVNIRRHFLHEVSNELVKTHDKLVIEDLNVAGMLRNRHLAKAISDAGWADFARLLCYKAAWRGGRVEIADRWYPSSQVCSHCGARNHGLTLAERVFTCACGYSADRDLNAAVNLANWPYNDACLEPRTPKQEAGPTMPADGKALAEAPTCVGETSSGEAGTDVQAASAQPEPRDVREGRCRTTQLEVFDTLQ
jgi:putative transposase